LFTSSNRSTRAIWWGLLACCAISVLVLALIPAQESPSTGWDKSNHLLAFATLTWLGWRAFPQRGWLVVLGLIGFGGLIEILQWFTPDRSAEWADLAADSVAVVLVSLLELAYAQLQRLRQTI
jgi:VanZ family protein